MKWIWACLFLAGCHYSSLHNSDLALLKEEKTFWNWEGRQIHYVEKGKGDNHLIFLHGFGANTFTWRQQIDSLAQKGYHVWAFDFLGFGFSDKPLEISYDLDLYQNQTLAFMDAMGIEKGHIAANSMGGAVAIATASFAPERVASLFLIDPLAESVDLPLSYSIGKKLGRLMLPFFSRNHVHRVLKEVYYDPHKITEEQIDAYWLPLRMEGGREVFIKVLKTFDPEILHFSYESIEVPVLLLWGENDPWIPVSHSDLLKEKLPQAIQKTIPSCGHTPQQEKPQEVNELLVQFLRANVL